MDHNPKENNYIPALGAHWLTPLYDFLFRIFMREGTIKGQFVEQLRIERDQKILDVGSGTGTLELMIKRQHPQAQVFGIDPDLQIIEIARRKAARVGLRADFRQGFASRIPYPDNSFDRVVSSFVIHHLKHDDKIRAFRESYRVLKPNGELHVVDFGKPHHTLVRAISFVMKNFEDVKDNILGSLPAMMTDAGFTGVEVSKNFMTVFGTASFYAARVGPRKELPTPHSRF